jgi:beta-lactamase regulating signal transducer with metallopeptidase domain
MMIVSWILQTTLITCGLSLAAALICRRERLSPAAAHAIWLLVLLRLLVPPGLLTWPWQIPINTRFEHRLPVEGYVDLIVTAPPESAEANPTRQADDSFATDESDRAVMTVRKNESLEEWALPADILLKVLAAIWLAGSLAVLVRQYLQWRTVRQLIRSTLPASVETVRTVRALARRLDVDPPAVRMLANLPSPLLVGTFSPILLWPQQLPLRGQDAANHAIVIHELAHRRRRDHWVRWLEIVAHLIWWWHPLFYLARRQLHRYAEWACDAWVIHLLPNARRIYAEAILQVCQSWNRVPDPAWILGIGGTTDDLKCRLARIMHQSAPCRLSRQTTAAFGVAALLIAPSWSLGFSTHGSENIASLRIPESLQHDLTDWFRAPLKEGDEIPPVANHLGATNHSELRETTKRTEAKHPSPSDFTTERYPLSRGKAQVLAHLLRSLAAPDRLRVEAFGNQIVITTRPQDQPIVARLVEVVAQSDSSENSR